MCPSASSLPIVRGRDWLREGSSCLCSGRSGGGSGSSERFVRRVITADCEMDEIVCMSRLEVCGEADGSSERALSAASSSTLRWARLSEEVDRLEERLDFVSSDLADIEQGEGEGVPAGFRFGGARGPEALQAAGGEACGNPQCDSVVTEGVGPCDGAIRL